MNTTTAPITLTTENAASASHPIGPYTVVTNSAFPFPCHYDRLAEAALTLAGRRKNMPNESHSLLDADGCIVPRSEIELGLAIMEREAVSTLAYIAHFREAAATEDAAQVQAETASQTVTEAGPTFDVHYTSSKALSGVNVKAKVGDLVIYCGCINSYNGQSRIARLTKTLLVLENGFRFDQFGRMRHTPGLSSGRRRIYDIQAA